MHKRWSYVFVLLLTLLICSTASAATKVNKVTWGVDPYNVLRFVIDTSEKADYTVELKNKDLVITVNGTLDSKVSKKAAIRSDIAKTMSVAEVNKKTVVTVPLNKVIKKSDYKSFVLKKDPTTGRPDRVVVDVTVNKKATSSVPTTKPATGTTKTPAVPVINYKTSGGIKGKLITLDPGHGGSDPGAVGQSGYREKQATLAISMKLRKELENRGAKVSMTRTTDKDVHTAGARATDAQELQARVDVGTANKADIFVSVHINGSTNKNVGGLSTYYFHKNNYDAKLARSIQNNMVKNFGLTDLGIRQANFYVVKRSGMPAVLLELGFITNKKEEKLLQSGWFQDKLAKSIAEGIEQYFK